MILIERDIRLRYRQTALGIVWVVLRPLIAAAILATIFGRLAKMPSEGQPYLLFVFCGLTAWTYFSQALQRASNSLVTNSQLVSKVYFPRVCHSACSCAGCFDRCRGHDRDSGDSDVRLSHAAHLALAGIAGFSLSRHSHRHRNIALVFGAEREISRLSVHASLFDSDLALRQARWFIRRVLSRSNGEPGMR